MHCFGYLSLGFPWVFLNRASSFSKALAVSMQSEKPLISESVTVNTSFRSKVPDTGIVSRCEASRCRPSRRLRATKSKRRHFYSFTPVHVAAPAPLFHTLPSRSRPGLLDRPAARQSFPSLISLISRLHAPKRDSQRRDILTAFLRVVPTHLFAFLEA